MIEVVHAPGEGHKPHIATINGVYFTCRSHGGRIFGGGTNPRRAYYDWLRMANDWQWIEKTFVPPPVQQSRPASVWKWLRRGRP